MAILMATIGALSSSANSVGGFVSISLLFVSFLFWLLGKRRQQCQRHTLPPGPTPFPLIGNLAQIDLSNPHRSFLAWKRRYGPIYSVWLPKLHVVIAGAKELDEYFLSPAYAEKFADRPTFSFLYGVFNNHQPDGDGIILARREVAKKNRSFALGAFRHLGISGPRGEALIRLHVDALVQRLAEKAANGPLVDDFHSQITFCIGNIIRHIVFGRYHTYNDPEFLHSKKFIDMAVKEISNTQLLLVNTYAPLRFVSPAFWRFRSAGFALQGMFLREIDAHVEQLRQQQQRQRAIQENGAVPGTTAAATDAGAGNRTMLEAATTRQQQKDDGAAQTTTECQTLPRATPDSNHQNGMAQQQEAQRQLSSSSLSSSSTRLEATTAANFIDAFLLASVGTEEVDEAAVPAEAARCNGGTGGNQQTKRTKNCWDDPAFKLSLALCAGDLWAGGLETLVATLSWAIVYMLNFPDTQQKLHHELSGRLGGRAFRLSDRKELPYLRAFIDELQRVINALPWNLPHSVSHEVLLCDGRWRIPADTQVMAQIGAVHLDPALYPDPEAFRPDRFLDADGNYTVPVWLKPFGVGKRMCLGESLAKMELSTILAALVQNFEFTPLFSDQVPSLHRNNGLVNVPDPFKCVIHLRTAEPILW